MLGIYCRVSTVTQKDNYSIVDQHKDGTAFAKKSNVAYREYEDIASGKSITRQGVSLTPV
jgi:DNA invertase Pin-like site-specific DNA recombinase